ncbi:MAG: prepilin-type N-terminal cleavage/methylation domain-containing protein [Kiritimatiellales bacterium]
MKKKGKRKGFTLIEIMLSISILGLLAALSIPAILGAYTSAQAKAKDRNIAEVEKAKGVLTLPIEIGMTGAMGLKTTDPFGEAAVASLCKVLRISDISALTVGSEAIVIGNLTEKAFYGIE